MTDTEIQSAMRDVLGRIAPEADLDAVGPNENLREVLELDSMDALHFLVGLHEALGVEIPPSAYGRLTTKANIVKFVQEASGRPAAKE